MSGVIVNYNNNALTSMSSSGTKTLLTSGKYCEGNFEVVYSEPTTSSLTVTPTETAQTFNATGVYGYKPVTINGISSTYVGSGIPLRSSADVYLSDTKIRGPKGYYSVAFSSQISTSYHQNPTFDLDFNTGVITAFHTAPLANYLLVGAETTSSTYQLNSLGAQTLYPSTADQTIASHRWLTGAQTIKSVTTSNLTAENIAEGVVVKVGDATNASRIAQITGTHSGAPKYTATIGSLSINGNEIYYNSSRIYQNTSFNYNAGDTLVLELYGTMGGCNIYEDGVRIAGTDMGSPYSYILPSHDITLYAQGGGAGTCYINAVVPSGYIKPSGVYDITSNGVYDVTNYVSASVNVPLPSALAFPTATSGTRVGNVIAYVYATSLNQFLNIPKGYNSSSQAYVMYGVNTVNLTASNIAEGVTVKIGDALNESRIAQITGTYAPAYYQAFRSIACKDVINCSATYMQEYFNSLRIISSYMFADCTFSASDIINFPNVSEILEFAFASQESYITGNNKVSFNFPSLSRMPYDNTAYDCQFFRNGSVAHVSMPIVSNIASSMFQSCNGLLSVYAPNVTSIGAGAFSNARLLQVADYSVCTYIAREVFYGCYSLSSINFPNCTQIGTSAFAYCSNLISASFPNCTSIGEKGFYSCIHLINAYFPSCISISGSAFYGCYSLSSINFSNCTYIGDNAFGYCSNLISVNFPSCTTLSFYAFRNCYNLINASFPQCISIGAYTFWACSSLQSISFPNCTYISEQGFYNCSNLQVASFPNCSYVGSQAFYSCSSLSIASFPNCKVFSTGAFSRCYNLISLYLNNVSSVPTFGNSMFNSTPISNYSTSAGRYGSIFVPSSLYAAFTTATSWSAYSARMVSI